MAFPSPPWKAFPWGALNSPKYGRGPYHFSGGLRGGSPSVFLITPICIISFGADRKTACRGLDIRRGFSIQRGHEIMCLEFAWPSILNSLDSESTLAKKTICSYEQTVKICKDRWHLTAKEGIQNFFLYLLLSRKLCMCLRSSNIDVNDRIHKSSSA